MSEINEKRGNRKDQCLNCLFASAVKFTEYGKYIVCECAENDMRYGRLISAVRPTCSYVKWKGLNQSVMVKENDEDPYLTKRGMQGKNKF